ncbi:glutamine amidotransferase [Chlorobaculum tepidum]|uniref:glutamine amidotransferase n=1 Tax=Chlorobaculum tepidum TaxID=1097 RepID=UPI0003227605|nr:glutamine amidotransferase [Chlorobaculum tepidum]
MKNLYIIKAGSAFATEAQRLGGFRGVGGARRCLLRSCVPGCDRLARDGDRQFAVERRHRVVDSGADRHPHGREAGTVSIELTPDGERDALFDGIPARFVANATYAQSVLWLPLGAVHLAFNGFEPNHAFRVGESAWGVQFHPEYTRQIMAVYLRDEIADLEAAAEDAGALRDAVTEAPFAGRVLTNFASFVSRTL